MIKLLRLCFAWYLTRGFWKYAHDLFRDRKASQRTIIANCDFIVKDKILLWQEQSFIMISSIFFLLNKNGGTCYISKKQECTVTGDDASCPALVGNQDNWVCCARCITVNHGYISAPCPKETRAAMVLSFKKAIQSKRNWTSNLNQHNIKTSNQSP